MEKDKVNATIAKGIVFILATNIIHMLISILTNLVLPKHLSTETYASIKTYQLYLTYVGVLHFGVVDGIYLKYGGKSICGIDRATMKNGLYTFRLFQLIIVVFGILFSLARQDAILAIVSLMVLPTNMLSYYKYLYQACGEYKDYAKIINIVTIGIFVTNMFLIIVIKSDYYLYYLLGYLFINASMWFFAEITFSRRYLENSGSRTELDIKGLIDNVKNGILLTLGNFASILVTSMDRWFVKLLIGTYDFAQYAFAVSLENFLNTAATPVTITFYNALCNDNSKSRVAQLRGCVVILSSFLITAAFPVKFIIEIYLEKYKGSISVCFFLFSAQLFYIVIKSIYVNLYKARKCQRKYFIKLLSSLGAGLLFNVIAYYINNVKEAYAIATMCSAIFWLIIVQMDFPEDRLSFKEMAYLTVVCTSFLFLGHFFNPIIGFLLYVLFVFTLCIIVMRETSKTLFGFILKHFKRRLWS